MNWFDTAASSSGLQAYQIAAEQERRLREEEEDMTPYRDEDLKDDWEFKILRSATGAFKNPQQLREILDEEAKAGWVLVEKFDQGRIRLKRPASAKRDDRMLGFDPYRTQVGASGMKIALLVVSLVVGVVVAVITAVAVLKG